MTAERLENIAHNPQFHKNCPLYNVVGYIDGVTLFLFLLLHQTYSFNYGYQEQYGNNVNLSSISTFFKMDIREHMPLSSKP